MLNKSSLTAKSLFIFIFIFLLQANSVFAQRIPPEVRRILENLPPDTLQKIIKESQPKGEMKFTALPPQQFFKPPVGVSAPFEPTEAWFQGGSAWAYELDKCRVDGKESLYIKNAYVFYLDEENLDSTFTTNQKARTANIKLNGRVDKWEGKCNSKDFRKAGSSEGGLEFAFTNTFHLKPRFFQSNSASGKIFGAGLDEIVKGVSQKGEPVAFSYAKSENKSSYDPKLLEALRKAGYPIPDVNPEEYEKAAQESLKAAGFSLDMNKPVFYGRLVSPRMLKFEGGEVPAVQIDFAISSGSIDADMLVYRPEGLVSQNSAPTRTGTGVVNSLTDNPFITKMSYAHSFSNFPTTESTSNAMQQSPSGGLLIPDSLQNSMGVQTFVNLDNDDKDGKFDKDDTNVAGGDNDLVKVVLRVNKKPLNQRKGKAKFEITDGKTFVKVWEKASKEKEFDFRDLVEANTKDFVEGTGKFKDFLIKELWIEGIKEQTSDGQKTKFKFTYYSNPRSVQYDVDETFVMTVIGIESIEWEARDNGLKLDGGKTEAVDKLDADPNHKNPGRENIPLKPEGVRVFPGKRLLSSRERGVNTGDGCGVTLTNTFDREPRNKVDVKVKLSVKPVEPIKVYFDSFDVDDPTADGEGTPNAGKTEDNDNEAWIDDENNSADNRGRVGSGPNAQAGKFPGEDESDGILEVVFDDIEKTFLFEVTMQPGDNFRVAGNVDRKFVRDLINNDKLQNVGTSVNDKNANKQRIIDPFVLSSTPSAVKDAEILYPEKYASKTLTVWRIFYAELDWMQNVKGNSVKGQIKSISHGLLRTTSTVQLDKNIRVAYGLPDNKGLENSFENGTLVVNGTEYKISGNTADFSQPDSITINGLVPKELEGKDFEIFDDDKDQYKAGRNYHFGNGGSLWEPDFYTTRKGETKTGVEERFAFAYIQPDYKTLSNPCKNPPFVINTKSDEDKDLVSNYWFDNIQTQASEDFWTVYVLGAFQGTAIEDGDPNSEGKGNAAAGRSGIIAGIADKQKIGVHIFYVGVLELNDGKLYPLAVNGKGEQDAVVHEIGHLFGAEHGDGKLMDQKDNFFSLKSLSKIRSAKHP